MTTYGIEIELSAPVDRRAIVAALRGAGIDAYTASYSGRDYSVWQVKDDCSLSPSAGHRFTAEIVSPVLTWGNAVHEAQVETVSRVLLALGCKVNRSCGGHVHVGVGHLSGDSLALLIENYDRLQSPAIDGLVRNNRQAASGGVHYAQPMSEQRVRVLAQFARDGLNDSFSNATHHGCNINANWYALRGTLEFRQRDASIHFQKIMGWVGFLMGLVQAADEGCVMGLAGFMDTTDEMLDTMEDVGYITPILKAWVLRQVDTIGAAEMIRNVEAQVSARISRLMSLQSRGTDPNSI